MTETAESLRVRGMRDLAPGEMARFRRVEGAFLSVCRGWGYEEVRTPTIEYLHLFTRAGTLAPTMLERVYSFLDWDGWSGERVVLRPDATIPVARLYAEALADRPVAKLCYVENVFRFARNDDRREGWQCGAEVLGDTWPVGDVEQILMALEVLSSLGIQHVGVKLSHTGVIRTLLNRAGFSLQEQVDLYDRILAGDLSVQREVEARLPELDAPLHLLFDTAGGGSPYVANIRSAFLPAVPELAAPLDELTVMGSALDGLGVPFTVSMAMVRDFEYYTGPVFRFEVDGHILGGGGRYDALAPLLGGGRTPASGFALDMNATVAALPEERGAEVAPALAVTAASGDPADLAAVFQLARAARAAGIGVRTASDAAGGWSVVVDASNGGVYHLRSPQGGRTAHRSVAEVLRAVEAGR